MALFQCFVGGGSINDIEKQLKTEVMTVRFSKNSHSIFTAEELTKILGVVNISANDKPNDRFDITTVDYIKIINDNQIQCNGRNGTNGWNGSVTYELTLVGY